MYLPIIEYVARQASFITIGRKAGILHWICKGDRLKMNKLKAWNNNSVVATKSRGSMTLKGQMKPTWRVSLMISLAGANSQSNVKKCTIVSSVFYQAWSSDDIAAEEQHVWTNWCTSKAAEFKQSVSKFKINTTTS